MNDEKTSVYRGKRVLVRFAEGRCIHSRNCVLGRPDVFVPNVDGPWIFPDAADVHDVCALVSSCPSGALTYEPLDGGPAEVAPLVNVLRVRENGPNAVRAKLEITGHGRMLRATLCRCGASKNKPFCDGSHSSSRFVATGEPPVKESSVLASRGGELLVEPQANGPLHVVGSLEVCTGTGRTVARVTETWLCRCGHSGDKPFCDGTHERVGFKAPGIGKAEKP
jgi:CDGSH-type Zn-finger protein/uncharacterized Fe-S cluster protein YjdI